MDTTTTQAPTISLILDLQSSQQKLLADAAKDIVNDEDLKTILRVDQAGLSGLANKQVGSTKELVPLHDITSFL